MMRSHSKPYRYPRWPLIKLAMSCIVLAFAGLVFLWLPLGWGRLNGLVPLVAALLSWFIQVRPKWIHEIKPSVDGLAIGSRRYKWTDIVKLQIEFIGNRRALTLRAQGTLPDILIKDDIPRFDELANECYFYAKQVRNK